MIGLIFYGAIILWGILSLVLGSKLPKWFKLKPVWSFAFVPAVFFMPVADEIIAMPQAYLLCKQAEEAFWYDPATKGGVAKYFSESYEEEKTIGLNIKVKIKSYTKVIKDNGHPAIKYSLIYFSSGYLNVPAGSSGRSMTLLLPDECPSPFKSIEKYQKTVKLLELKSEPRPNF